MSPHKSLSTAELAVPSARASSNQSPLHTMSHPVLDTKDRRSYEHSRQKHLHPSDRQTSRSHNGWKRHVGNSRKAHVAGPISGIRWLPQINRDDLGVEFDVDYVGPYEDRGYDLGESQTTHVLPLELSLSDLLRPPRKQKGQNPFH